MQDKGKRNIADSPEGEQRCKIKVDPVIMKESLET